MLTIKHDIDILKKDCLPAMLRVLIEAGSKQVL